MLALVRVGTRGVINLLTHIWTSIIVPLVVVAADDPPDTVQAEEAVGSVDQEEPEGGGPLPQLAPVEGLRAEYH
ncbi:MAG: hypothetical protein F4139_14010 [Gemmatimonadetes bacterium]|nr:hypothetical protein [Gemmatimonadota bacterium]